jgi:hypothetical protein
MAQFVITGTVGKDKKYLALESCVGYWWSSRIKDAYIVSTKEKAEELLSDVTNESESHMTDGSVYSPRTIRGLAGICNSVKKADIKLSIAVIGITPIETQRWHVEDGKGNTKRLS